jgi:hypothetical protein
MRAVWCLLLLAACDIGNTGPGTGGGGNGPDAALDSSGPMWADAPVGSGSNGPCENPVTTYGDGHHNAGKDCEQGCHNHGFTVSGTLYTNANGNTGYPGATITLTDAQNRAIKLVTQANGNFYTSSAVAFPVTARASACPLGTSMNANVASGRCNNTACHAQATAVQIHLP